MRRHPTSLKTFDSFDNRVGVSTKDTLNIFFKKLFHLKKQSETLASTSSTMVYQLVKTITIHWSRRLYIIKWYLTYISFLLLRSNVRVLIKKKTIYLKHYIAFKLLKIAIERFIMRLVLQLYVHSKNINGCLNLYQIVFWHYIVFNLF